MSRPRRNSYICSTKIWNAFNQSVFNFPFTKKHFWEKTGLDEHMSFSVFSRAINGDYISLDASQALEAAFKTHWEDPMKVLQELTQISPEQGQPHVEVQITDLYLLAGLWDLVNPAKIDRDTA